MSFIVEIFSCLYMLAAITQTLPAMQIHLGQFLSSFKTILVKKFWSTSLPVIEVDESNAASPSFMIVEEEVAVQEVRSADLSGNTEYFEEDEASNFIVVPQATIEIDESNVLIPPMASVQEESPCDEFEDENLVKWPCNAEYIEEGKGVNVVVAPHEILEIAELIVWIPSIANALCDKVQEMKPTESSSEEDQLVNLVLAPRKSHEETTQSITGDHCNHNLDDSAIAHYFRSLWMLSGRHSVDRGLDLMRKGKPRSYFGERIRQYCNKQSDQVAVEIYALHTMALVSQPTNEIDKTLTKILWN